MLLDIVETYDKDKTEYLLQFWEKIIKTLANQSDIKKIISFLQKCGIVGIEEGEKVIYIGVPNEFVLTQVKKFFFKELNNTIKEIYNPYFKVQFIIYPKFQTGRHTLQINLAKSLGKETKTKQQIDSPIKQKLTDYFGILFDKKYQFNNFIVGSSNELVFSAAKQVAEHPGKVYNPLFIYGNVGLGKTHLLQAVGNYTIENNPNLVVIYLPTTKLIDEIVNAIRNNKLNALSNKLEEVDILILDDIQFLAEKEKTQEIFHNIFNDFHLRKKQIIISSDRPPKDLNLLEARLRSRFALGLVGDIKKPDYETRFAILKSKLHEKGEQIDDKFLDIITKSVKDNIRELEGALNIVLTKKNLLGKELHVNLIKESLETLGYNLDDNNILSSENSQNANSKNIRNKENFSRVIEFVANYYNISIFDLKGENRKKEVSQARQMLMYIAKHYFEWTLEKIGDYFGGKNHATVIYAINNFKKQLKHNEKLSHDYEIITESLK